MPSPSPLQFLDAKLRTADQEHHTQEQTAHTERARAFAEGERFMLNTMRGWLAAAKAGRRRGRPLGERERQGM